LIATSFLKIIILNGTESFLTDCEKTYTHTTLKLFFKTRINQDG